MTRPLEFKKCVLVTNIVVVRYYAVAQEDTALLLDEGPAPIEQGHVAVWHTDKSPPLLETMCLEKFLYWYAVDGDAGNVFAQASMDAAPSYDEWCDSLEPGAEKAVVS